MTIEAAALEALKAELGKVHGDYKEVTETQAEILNAQKNTKESVRAVEKELDEMNMRIASNQMQGGSKVRRIGAAFQLAKELQDSAAYRQVIGSGKGGVSFAIETPISAALGTEGQVGEGMSTVPSDPERSGYHIAPSPALSLLNVLPSRPTSRDAVEHVRFGISSGNADYQTLEGDEKSNIEMGGALVKANIATIAGTTAASRQSLADQTELQNSIYTVLRNNVSAKLENELINGVGGQGKIEGLIKAGTAYSSTAKGTADIIGECVTAMQDDGFNPSIIAIKASQWFTDVASLKDKNGQYIIGNPAQPATPTLWGGSVVKPASLPDKTILVLDPAYITVLDRQVVQVLVSESHKDYFTRNLIQILCELRAGLEITNAKAIRVITLS